VNTTPDVYDAIIIGGGPSGATAGILLARAGLKALILEKVRHPRFRIGESFLPRCYAFMRDVLGLEKQVQALPHVDKWGAEFGMGDTPSDETARFAFKKSLTPDGRTFNIERSVFDEMMIRQAAKEGAEVWEGVGVKEILELADGQVRVQTSSGEVHGKWLLDATGPTTVVAKHLGTRVNATESHLRKVAYFGHFQGVERLAGEEEGHPLIIMCDEGWFWVIPINDRVTSVGLVMDATIAKSLDVPADRLLDWGIQRCPLLRERMQNATGPEKNQVIPDFTFRCRPYAGPGYFLLGDAAAFIDPIFSTGVCLGMMTAANAVEQIIAVNRNELPPQQAREKYIRYLEGSTDVFFKLINSYYHHAFREMFLNGKGPLSIHRAVLSVLAGHVFPRPPWRLRWRLKLFYFCLKLQRRGWPLVPKRPRFSLRDQEPMEWRNESTCETPLVASSAVA
jgi:flavin-dependent dehydrogenase